jgi:hypothetical protein
MTDSASLPSKKHTLLPERLVNRIADAVSTIQRDTTAAYSEAAKASAGKIAGLVAEYKTSYVDMTTTDPTKRPSYSSAEVVLAKDIQNALVSANLIQFSQLRTDVDAQLETLKRSWFELHFAPLKAMLQPKHSDAAESEDLAALRKTALTQLKRFNAMSLGCHSVSDHADVALLHCLGAVARHDPELEKYMDADGGQFTVDLFNQPPLDKDLGDRYRAAVGGFGKA